MSHDRSARSTKMKYLKMVNTLAKGVSKTSSMYHVMVTADHVLLQLLVLIIQWCWHHSALPGHIEWSDPNIWSYGFILNNIGVK